MEMNQYFQHNLFISIYVKKKKTLFDQSKLKYAIVITY